MAQINQTNWLIQTSQLSEKGDARAQFALGLAYWHGKIVKKDVEMALSLLRRSEGFFGEQAWVEMIRILAIEKDPRIHDVFSERENHQNGVACFIYGSYLADVDLNRAVDIYEMGSDAGHIGCSIQHHLRTHRGIRAMLGMPRLIGLFVRGFKLALREDEKSKWQV